MSYWGIGAAEGLIALWVGIILGGIILRLRKVGSEISSEIS